MDEINRIMSNIQNMYTDIGSSLDASGGVHRCKVCGYEIPHMPGDGARYTAHGYPKHCGKTTRWVTQRQLDEEAANAKGRGNE